MSAPVMESPRIPLDLPSAEQASGFNFVAIVRRRWPWVLVGLFIGIVGGLLAHTIKKPVYQSNAQLLVVKKREHIGTGQSAMVNYLEDYMATQATILKSESVMARAAQAIPNLPLQVPYPPEQTERVKMLNLAFNVSREKDPNNPAAINNVLNISVKGANPSDCKLILDTIIKAYKDELKGVYDEATKEKIQLLDAAIRSHKEETENSIKAKSEAINEITVQTNESAQMLQIRLSETTKLKRLLENEEKEIRGYLAAIKNAGDDKKERQMQLMRLAGTMRGNYQQGLVNPRIDPNDPMYQKQELEAQHAELSKKYGKDHPIIEQVTARIEFLRHLYAQQNPADPDGKLDGLDQLEAFLKTRLQTIGEQIESMKADIATDNAKLKIVQPLQNKADSLEKFIEARTKLIDTYNSERLQTELTRASGGFQATALNQPSMDDLPVSPKLNQNLLLGMAAGLLFGVGLAALAELSDKGFRSPADIRARLGLPVIGHIPPIRTNQAVEQNLDLEPTMVTALRPKSVEAEAYRGVRTALYFNAAGSTHQMIQVTSPSQGDGKSTLACNLAVSIAQSGKRTLLVDCDMRRPRVHRVFHMQDVGPGLAHVIAGDVPLSQAIKRTPIENLSILPCGKKPDNPAELLTSPNFPDLLDRLKHDYDYVILDTPPVLAVSDPSAVAPRADGVILVFRMTSKVRPLAERAREQLNQIGANVIGVVVNGAGRSESGYGSGYGTDYSGYTATGGYMENYESDDEPEPDSDADNAPPKKG